MKCEILDILLESFLLESSLNITRLDDDLTVHEPLFHEDTLFIIQILSYFVVALVFTTFIRVWREKSVNQTRESTKETWNETTMGVPTLFTFAYKEEKLPSTRIQIVAALLRNTVEQTHQWGVISTRRPCLQRSICSFFRSRFWFHGFQMGIIPLTFLLAISVAEAHKILVYNVKFAHSHSNYLGNVADILVDAGHDVVRFHCICLF